MSDASITAPALGTKLGTRLIGDIHHPTSVLVDGTGADVLGLVSATPDATTVLGRLKTATDALTPLAGYLDGVEAALAAILAATGGLPNGAATATGVAAVKTSVDALAPYLDGLEGLLGTLTAAVTAAGAVLPTGAATSARQDSIIGFVDGIETALAALLLIGTERYTLANGVTLGAPGSGSEFGPEVTVPRGAGYILDMVFTGSSPSLKLQRRGADGATWFDGVTRTATGAGTDPVLIGSGAVLRLANASAGALTNVYATLS